MTALGRGMQKRGGNVVSAVRGPPAAEDVGVEGHGLLMPGALRSVWGENCSEETVECRCDGQFYA